MIEMGQKEPLGARIFRRIHKAMRREDGLYLIAHNYALPERARTVGRSYLGRLGFVVFIKYVTGTYSGS